MGTSSTTNSDILALAKSEQEKLDQAIKAVKAAKQRVQDQEEAYLQKLAESLRGKIILFTGSLVAEDMFGQDGIEMHDTHDRLKDERLVVTNVFFQDNRFGSPRVPIVYATREQHFRKKSLGGRVSFMLLRAQQVTIVE